MRCWEVVAIAGGIGEIAVVNCWLHHSLVGSNNRLLNCLGFLDRFSMRSLNMMDRKVGGSNSESQGISNVVDCLNNCIIRIFEN